MRTYQLHINMGSGHGSVPVVVQARSAEDARRIARAQYGAGKLANGGYVTELR